VATFRPRRFSNRNTLRSIATERLLAFLRPHSVFLDSRGLRLPLHAPWELNYEALAEILMLPDANTPPDLVDAIYLVDEMATPEGMESLLESAAQVGLILDKGNEHTPADIAVQVWLLNRNILERKHAEQFLYKRRSFEYFQAQSKLPPNFELPSPDGHAKFELELAEWFEAKKRGKRCRILIFPRHNEVAFLIRHGGVFQREESENGDDVVTVSYRPIKYDVVIYDRDLRELRINAELASEKKFYCEQFGKHLFGDIARFPGTNKYTLDPLRELGADSLAHADIEGIEEVKLVEIEFFWGGAYRARGIMKADDVFADLETQNRKLPEVGRITRAIFKLKFADSKCARSVMIKPTNVARYTRETDAVLVEQWLQRRGFITIRQESPDEQPVSVMAGS